MASIVSVQDGDWNTASTWDLGTVPTSSDNVTIQHTVTLAGNASANYIYISNGSLITSPSWDMSSKATLTCAKIYMYRRLNDVRQVRLDGMTIVTSYPRITCIGSSDGFPQTDDLELYPSILIIDDPGMLAFTAQMQDIKPEGCAKAYARKVSNGVRYMNVNIHIKCDRCDKIGQLYRMAENPFQVLAVTNSAVIKGFIEAITPIDSVGKEYRSFRVSIAEGI